MIMHETWREIALFSMWCDLALCYLRSLEDFPVSSRELFLTADPYLGEWADYLWAGALVWMGAMVDGDWSFTFPIEEKP